MKHLAYFIIFIAVVIFCVHSIEQSSAAPLASDSGLVAELENLKIVERDHQCLEVDFVLKNTSSKPVALAERWNSWGADQWSFKLTDAKGNIFRFTNPQRIWFANAFTVFTIPPKETKTFPCRLSLVDQGFHDATHYLFSANTEVYASANAVDPGFGPSLPVHIVKVLPSVWSYPIKLEGIFSAPVIHRIQSGEQSIETNWQSSISTPTLKLTGLEEGSSGQPAAPSQLKSDGKEKPQPESKVRSR